MTKKCFLLFREVIPRSVAVDVLHFGTRCHRNVTTLACFFSPLDTSVLRVFHYFLRFFASESPAPPFLLGGIDIQLCFSAIFNLISHVSHVTPSFMSCPLLWHMPYSNPKKYHPMWEQKFFFQYIGVFKKTDVSPMCTLSRLMQTHHVSANILTVSYTFEQQCTAFTYNRLSVSFEP